MQHTIKFREVPIGDRFLKEREATHPWLPGRKGPWVRSSTSRYRHADDDSVTVFVDSNEMDMPVVVDDGKRIRKSKPEPKLVLELELFEVKLDQQGYDSKGGYHGTGEKLYRYKGERLYGKNEVHYGHNDTMYVDAYVRVGNLTKAKAEIRKLHPEAKF